MTKIFSFGKLLIFAGPHVPDIFVPSKGRNMERGTIGGEVVGAYKRMCVRKAIETINYTTNERKPHVRQILEK